ncbi:MAG: hypothetical protein JSU77_04105 [Fidelibacterota bacterium]|nr:MAG: hypothetical protein JSU77_04105 [Candidatus Neomarinimicrobiota bacterium]
MTVSRLFSRLLVITITYGSLAYGQSVPYREYQILLGQPQELEMIAKAGNTLNKAIQDLYLKGIGPRLPEKVQPFVETFWSVYGTFLCSLWPHEFGHWARAQQVGGNFIIQSFGLPFPRAKMDVPASLSPQEEALPSIGGHEINYLMMRQTHLDFYSKDFSYALDIVHAFIQQVYYPVYAFMIAPADPEEPSTWTDTRGDPVESALIVYQNYTNRDAIRGDGSVDPELVSYYREAVYLSVLWTLLDPMLYQSTKAFGADMEQDYGLMTPWMLGDENESWTWGTQFNPSPLGYELYFNNYLRLRQKLYAFYIKTGRPYKNIGIGIQAPSLIETGNLTLGAACDLWNQDIHGKGAAVSLDIKYQFYEGFGLLLRGSWKDDGYLVGRRLEQSVALFAGVSYRY